MTRVRPWKPGLPQADCRLCGLRCVQEALVVGRVRSMREGDGSVSLYTTSLGLLLFGWWFW